MEGVLPIIIVIIVALIVIIILNIFFAYIPIGDMRNTVNETAADVDRAVARAERIEDKIDNLADRAEVVITEIEQVGQDIASFVTTLETFICQSPFAGDFDFCNGGATTNANVVSQLF